MVIRLRWVINEGIIQVSVYSEGAKTSHQRLDLVKVDTNSTFKSMTVSLTLKLHEAR